MNKREEIISLWFEMWLQKKDLGIFKIFSNNTTYIESWGPRYDSSKKIKLWFDEWNNRGTVLKWDIKQFFHKENQTIVEWYFECQMEAEEATEFDGMSLIEWTDDNKIKFLKEFGCNINNYDPYKSGNIPKFKDTEISWF
ncbi:conjugal transfer protein [Ligilactobacillus salivarius]|uniref:Conjugal transfer protein n=1 Tax=Ligilactobacillus salivarius TaxID=1624 RepID=A0A1Y0FAI3_9LACO|nr:conjugal transfer protein [Ligilactobacillus salivarius]ARU20360.1 conjugal transfer protein [Ligilactobacillus salivarius]